MNFRPTTTLANVIARAAFEAEKNDNANHLIDRLLLLALDEPHSHAARILQQFKDENQIEHICAHIECELCDVEPADRVERATIRNHFFTKIHDLLSSALMAGEPANTGHILLLALADPTTISGEVLRCNLIGYQRVIETMGTLAVDEDRYFDLRLK